MTEKKVEKNEQNHNKHEAIISIHQISVNLENFKFSDQISPKIMNDKNFEKINIKIIISI